jgi:hypothetical protein
VDSSALNWWTPGLIGASTRSGDGGASAGYAFINTAAPDQTLEPGNPDADQHNISIGFGYRDTPLIVDGFYNVSLYRDRSARGTTGPTEHRAFSRVQHRQDISKSQKNAPQQDDHHEADAIACQDHRAPSSGRLRRWLFVLDHRRAPGHRISASRLGKTRHQELSDSRKPCSQ